jgi:23S rRNA (adenine-N6)-dimethyltransferase
MAGGRAPAPPYGATRSTLLTQLEFALKRSGGYGRWSRLTVLTWPTLEWSFHGRVAARSFHPVPRVDSGILGIARRGAPLLSARELRAFRRAVEVGFLGAGGNVGASLRREFGRTATVRALGDAAVAPSTIVARVHPDAWVVVGRNLAGHAD